MCSPEMLIVSSMVTKGVSNAMSYRSQAAQYDAEARDLDRQTADERLAGAREQQRVERTGRRVAGQQRNAASAGGLELSGSVLDVIEESATEAQMDIEAIRFNTQSRASSLKASADNRRAAAKDSRRAAPLAFLAPVLEGATTLKMAGAF